MTKKENLVRTITRDGPAFVPYRYDGSLTTLWPAVSARPREGGLDDWGLRWIPTDTEEGSYLDGTPRIRMEQIGELEVPDTDFGRVTDDLRRQIADLGDTDTLIVVRNEMVMFERARSLLGMTEYLMACVTDPDAVHALLEKITGYQRRLTRAMMESGAAGVRFTDDWGMQNALFIHPAQWRAFMKDRLRSLYDIVKEYDGLVFQHSCGHIEEVVPDLIEIGLDVLDPCQPQANDIFRWKREYGDRLSFMGGLDTQTYLTFGRPAEIRSTVGDVISIMSDGGGYIAAPSHTITLPEENRRAMVDGIADVNSRRDADRRS